jgi:hypothetical protein
LNPPKASILRGVTIPPYGGDTFWTNLAVAYQGLSETMRGIVDGLRGVHRFQAPTGIAKSQVYDESVRRREMETEHPIVRVHPETGERVLFVSPSFLKTRRRPESCGKEKWRTLPVVKLTTNAPPGRAATGGTRHGPRYQEAGCFA